MKYVVYLHSLRKLQFVAYRPMFLEYFEGSQFGVVQLVAWSFCFDVLS